MIGINKTSIFIIGLIFLSGLALHQRTSAQEREQKVGPVSEENSPAACRNGYALVGIYCQGAYCDNKTLLCRSYTRIDHSASYSWSDWFSEEGSNTGRNTVQSSSGFVTGIACSGAYCDNLRLQILESSILHNAGGCHPRSRTFSEERNPVAHDICPSGEFVAGLSCFESYCDKLQLICCRGRVTQ